MQLSCKYVCVRGVRVGVTVSVCVRSTRNSVISALWSDDMKTE